MNLRAISYEVDGKSFLGYTADGSRGGHVPGILIAHEGGGLTDHTKQRALMLAELGYVAFAMDMFGESTTSLEQAKSIVQSLRANWPVLRQRGNAALQLLKSLPHVDASRIAAIGFCFGGTMVLELARSGADLRCVVGFHAGLAALAPPEVSALKCKVLVCQGADDPVIDAEQRDTFAAEMSKAKADWQMIVYGGVGHSFTNASIDAWKIPGFAYDAAADRRSWRAMCSFLAETLDTEAQFDHG
jgi:dienelactone hydrolase